MTVVRVKKPGGLDNLYVDQRSVAAPGPGEVSLRVHATSLNYHDYLVAVGHLPSEDGRVPMSDGAGVVTAVGEGVSEFAVGDRVVSTFFSDCVDGDVQDRHHSLTFGDGIDGFACTEATVPQTGLTHAPVGYSHEEAATLPCAAVTAWRALVYEGGIKPGDTVLVQGTGGVSLFALQFAKAAGARVIATTSSPAKMEKLRALGADEVVNYREYPEWSAQVMALTQGRGVDHVVEIGGAGTFAQSMQSCRNGGHISMIGVLAGFSGEVPTAAIMGRQLKVKGITVGSRRQQQDMIRAIDVNGIRPVIDDKIFALESLAEAFRYQESGGHFGKIVVTM
ncbi:NAD(P)-dependent alcohol dehydrogenase [Spongiibacter sp. KMU-166]|uniref:NAD(P)-dependent alcohol dehydrogenase n=1 Tax=Spongiibacter thalassae TaxID=2721624 RepID=A0ABX1GC39_9GAMM|nr:NAD(P)-dependent alcohol dehydrogenase [Spongiibacter thalassae]NKI16163.1 NAD(P)-dependent alcohol dehydrogenase [Spongiibacter thalassae]